jgi:quercetin dioxygenase-like cupin family protein
MKAEAASAAPQRRDTFPDRIRALEPFRERFAAFRLRAEACNVLFATYPAGTEIEPHTHPSDKWCVVLRGRIVLAVNGSEQDLGPGEWYHIPPRTRHSARCAVETEQIEFWFKPPALPRHLRFGRARAGRVRAPARE